MPKKLTSQKDAELNGYLQDMISNNIGESDIQSFANDFVDKYGVDETTEVKKKVDGKPLVLQSNIPSQSTENLPSNGSLGVNDFYPKGFAPEPTEVSKAVAKAKPQEKVEYLKKAYRNNPLLPQSVSDEDLNTTFSKKLEKDPNIADNIVHGIISKEKTDEQTANAPLEYFGQLKHNIDNSIGEDFYDESKQSRQGKVADNLYKLTSGGMLSADDGQYTEKYAPVAYKQALNGMDLGLANQFYQQKAQQEDIVSKGQQLKKQVDYLATETGMPKEELAVNLGVVGNEATQNLIKEHDAKKQDELKLIESTYRDEIDPFTNTLKVNPDKNYAIAKLDAQDKIFKQSLGNANAFAFAMKNVPQIVKDNTIKVEDIGMESFKIQNPSGYQMYIMGGQTSQAVKAQTWQLGIYAMKASNNPELVKKALEEEPKYYAKYPKELDDETIRRLSVEYYKHKEAMFGGEGLNSFYNDPHATVQDLDKIADQLPKEFKDHYYNDIRKKAVGSDIVFATKGVVRKAGDGYGIVPLMNPKGFLNSAIDDFAETTVKQVKGIGNLVGARNDAKVANEVLDGTPITEQPVFDSNENIEKRIGELEVLAKDKKLTPDDAQEYKDLQEKRSAIPYGYDKGNMYGGLLGMTAQMIISSKGLGAGFNAVGKGVSRMGTAFGEPLVNNIVLSPLGLASDGIAVSTPAQVTAEAVTLLKNSNELGGMASMGLMVQDEAKKRAIELMPNKDQAGARALYTFTRTAIWSSLSRVFPMEKVLDGFVPEVESKIATLSEQLAKGKIDKIAYSTGIEKLGNSIVKGLAGSGKDALKLTGEMGFGEVTNRVLDYYANPQAFNSKEARDAIGWTFGNTWLNMLPLILLKGGQAGLNSHVGINSLSPLFTKEGAEHFNSISDALVLKGELTQKEADINRATTIEAQKIESISMKDVDNVRKLPPKQYDLYRTYLLGEKILEKQVETSTDVPFKAKAEKSIAESQKKRAQILDGEYAIDENYNFKTVKEIQDEIIAKKDAEAKKIQEEELLKTQNNETTNIETTDSEITATNGGQSGKTQSKVATEGTVNPNRVEVAKLVGKERKDLITSLELTEDQKRDFYKTPKEEKDNFLQKIVDEKQKVGDGSDVPSVVATEPTPTEKAQPLPMVDKVHESRANWSEEDYTKHIEKLNADKKPESEVPPSDSVLGEPLNASEEAQLKQLYKKDFLKQEMTSQEQQDFVNLKNKKNESKRKQALDNQLQDGYVGFGRFETNVDKSEVNALLYNGLNNRSVIQKSNGKYILVIKKFNQKNGQFENTHTSEHETLSDATNEYKKHNKGIEDEINSMFDDNKEPQLSKEKNNSVLDYHKEINSVIDKQIENTQNELNARKAEIKDEPTLTKEISDLEKERDDKVKELDLHLDFETDAEALKKETKSGKQTKISSKGQIAERPEQKRDVQNEIKAKQEILKRIKKCL